MSLLFPGGDAVVTNDLCTSCLSFSPGVMLWLLMTGVPAVSPIPRG